MTLFLYDLYITHKNCDVKYILHKDVKTLLDEEEISLETDKKQHKIEILT